MSDARKRDLLAHLRERHAVAFERSGVRSGSLERLQRWHAGQHHRYWTNHMHAGANTGPNERPEGWKSGLDVVERS